MISNTIKVIFAAEDKNLSATLDKIRSKVQNLKEVRSQYLKPFAAEWLSVMFAGMQVSKLMERTAKNLIDTWKKLDSKGATPLSKAMTKLEASFTFFKYSLVEAASPLLEKLILWLADLAMWAADLDPKLLEAIAIGIGALWVAGIALFTGAQIKLFADGISNILTLSKINPKNITTLTGAIGGLANIGAITIAFKGVWDITQGDVELGLAEALAGAAWFVKGPMGAALAGISMALVLSKIVKGDALGNMDQLALDISAMFGAAKIFAWNSSLGAFTFLIWGIFRGIKWQMDARKDKGEKASVFTDLFGWGVGGEDNWFVGGLRKLFDPFETKGGKKPQLTFDLSGLDEASNKFNAFKNNTIIPVNESISKSPGGLTPIVDFLNVSLQSNATNLDNLINVSPNLVTALTNEKKAHNEKAEAVNKEAAAYERLARAKSSVANTSSTSTGSRVQTTTIYGK